jgi:hypothetical protein
MIKKIFVLLFATLLVLSLFLAVLPMDLSGACCKSGDGKSECCGECCKASPTMCIAGPCRVLL